MRGFVLLVLPGTFPPAKPAQPAAGSALNASLEGKNDNDDQDERDHKSFNDFLDSLRHGTSCVQRLQSPLAVLPLAGKKVSCRANLPGMKRTPGPSQSPGAGCACLFLRLKPDTKLALFCI